MAEQTRQTYANHRRWDPLFHFFLLPVAAINLVVTIVHVIRNPGLGAGWFVVLALAAAIAVVKIRTYALKAQDRVIRLEERLRRPPGSNPGAARESRGASSSTSL